MKQGAYLLVTSSIFALIALLHALRLFYGWKATMEEWTVRSGSAGSVFSLGDISLGKGSC